MINHSSMPTIGFPFVGDTVGGSHVSTILLMQELQQLGFRAIALVHDDGPLTSYLNAKNVDFLRTGLPYLDYNKSGISALARSLFIAPQIATFVRRNNLALIHVNDGRMIASWTLALRLAGRPIILHARHRWSQSRLADLCFRLAKKNIAISSYVRDSMPTEIAKDTKIISNPFEVAVVDTTDAQKNIFGLIARERCPVIAFAGTLMQQKRPSVFLDTAAYLSHKTDAHFVLFGRNGDSHRGLREQVVKLGIEERVTFAGYRRDFEYLLAGCDMLVAPAVNEGHGRVLVEAMLAGVPVVAANSGGHKEIIQNRKTGLLVNPDDPSAFARAAMHILNEPDFKEKIVETARFWATSTFSPRNHALKVSGIYRSSLKTF